MAAGWVVVETQRFSDPDNIACGVTLRSVLGPLLSWTYVKDLPQIVIKGRLSYRFTQCVIITQTR